MSLTTAQKIGKVIYQNRLNQGFKHRSDLVDTASVKGRLTQEGLRKIEQGERIPRLENLELLGKALNLSKKKVQELEEMALEENIKRVTRRAGNAPVEFKIHGHALKMTALPPTRKTEAFVRETVSDLIKLVEKYGIMAEDVEHFRRHARGILTKKLENA